MIWSSTATSRARFTPQLTTAYAPRGGCRTAAPARPTDGGANWKRLEGGLPRGQIGRIGIDIYQKDSKALYALVDYRNRRAAGEDLIRLTLAERGLVKIEQT